MQVDLTYCEAETPVSLTFCPLCKERGDEIVIGEVFKYVGEDGAVFGYGHPGGELAHALIENNIIYGAQSLKEDEQAPGGHPCSNCSAEIAHQRKEFELEVSKGGIHWSCRECGIYGVIVHDDSLGFSSGTRGAAGVQPPNQLRVNFSNCVQHASVEDPADTIQ